MSKKQAKIIRGFFLHDSVLRKSLNEKKSKIFGTAKQYELDGVSGLRNLKYLYAIPIVKNNKVHAFILMLFEKRSDILHLDLFGEIFSFQVRLILENLKII